MLNYDLKLNHGRSSEPLHNICIRGKSGTGKTSLALDILIDICKQSQVNVHLIADESIDVYRNAAKELSGIFTPNFYTTFHSMLQEEFDAVHRKYGLCDLYGWEHISACSIGESSDTHMFPCVTLIDCAYIDTMYNSGNILDILSKWNRMSKITACYYIIIVNNPWIFSMAPVQFQTVKTYGNCGLEAFRIRNNEFAEKVHFDYYHGL